MYRYIEINNKHKCMYVCFDHAKGPHVSGHVSGKWSADQAIFFGGCNKRIVLCSDKIYSIVFS